MVGMIKRILNRIDKLFLRKDGKQDYCTCAPDVIFNVDLGPACEIHDFHCQNMDIEREEADIQFYHNIRAIFNEQNKKVKGFFVANVYYLAVRIAETVN